MRSLVPNVSAILALLLAALPIQAAAHSGVVRYNGQVVPGATVTATQGARKVTTSTGENGRYDLDLPDGDWTVEVQMFGFEPAKRTVTQAASGTPLEWTLQFQAPPSRPAVPAPVRRGFQESALRRLAEEPLPDISVPEQRTPEVDSSESFVMTGSLSQGLQAPQQQDMGFLAMRDSLQGDRPGGPGEPGSPFGDTSAAGGVAAGRPGFGGPGGGGGRFGGGMGGGFGGRGGPGGFGGGRGPGMRGGDGRGGPERSFGNRRNRGQQGIRGMLSYQVANSAFDARPYSLNGQPFAKPAYAQNRFGLMLGGQLRIPKLIDLKRTYFTLSYNGSLNRSAYSAFATMPTEAERGGDFSQTLVRGPAIIYDPLTHQPFPDNRIPASRMNPAALGLLQLMPHANLPGTVQNYQYVTTVPRDSNSLSLRVNQSITAKNRITAGINWQNRSSDAAQLYGWKDQSSGGGLSSDTGWSYTFGPRKVNDLHLKISRNRAETLPFFAYGENISAELGIQGPSGKPSTYGPPNLNFTNYGDLTDGNPVLQRNQSVGFSDAFNLVKGKHTAQFGFEFRRAQFNTNTDQNARGAFIFSGLATSGFDERGLPLTGTGFDFADFLLGLPQSSSIRYGTTDTYFRSSVYSAFAQDEWRARPNLTLNLGLRYEYFTPFSEKYGHMANLDVAPGFTGVAVVTPDAIGPYTGAFPAGLVQPDRNNLAPRVGFAWRPIAKSRLQLRGGYSVFYDSSIYNTTAVRLAAQPPFASTASITTSLQRTLTLQDGFGNDPSKQVTNTFAVARNYRVPYAQTWNFSVQQELPGAFVLEVGYLGTKGTRLDIQRLPNRAAPGSPLTSEQRRQISNAVGFTYDSSEGNSIFHAAQVRVVRRFRKGMSMNALYTFSKSIDNASTIGGAGNIVAQDDRNLAAERGLSTFDQRHKLTWTGMVTSPFGENAFWLKNRSLGSRLLRDWTISTSLSAHSGLPFTARVLGNIADTAGTGTVGSGRADSTGLPIDSGGGFFNPAAFTVPPSGRFGNAGRNTITGPSFATLGASLSRSFAITERRRVEFRVSADNITNHVNYTSIATVVNATNYGLATAVSQMRTLSASFRMRF